MIAADGANCGRVKDLYFDDQTWTIKYIVVALEPRRFGQTHIVLTPEQIRGFNTADELELTFPSDEVRNLRLASTVLPVCKQYASIALSSPGASHHARGQTLDPHLRSAKLVMNYCLNVAGEFSGTLADFLFEDASWEIRYLAVSQVIDRKKLQFHVLPQSVERFTWATQRVILRGLQPVELAQQVDPAQAAA